LGIAERFIQVSYASNLSQLKQPKVLNSNVKTLSDWLKVKRLEKNLTPGHVAAKMGIATSLVCSWESSTRQPDGQQLKILSSVLEFDAKEFETLTNNPASLLCVTFDNQSKSSCTC
jgi:transcriptional regulator with XRE-family HTH domain